MTTKVEGPITSVGIMAGTIMITPQGSLPITVKVSENQRAKLLPRLTIGDVIAVNVDESGNVIPGESILCQRRQLLFRETNGSHIVGFEMLDKITRCKIFLFIWCRVQRLIVSCCACCCFW